MATGQGQRADQVHMDVGETAVGNRNGSRLQVDVAVYLPPLAGEAGTCQGRPPVWPGKANRSRRTPTAS